ncbi:MAG: hypothetical protein M3373_11655 [Gemmatimonadota bacterium]|nr:hypothetical protein [Gemmatimonadota bacterium]
MPRFISFRELRNTPGAVREAIRDEGAIALTANGEPVAIVFSVEEGDVEEALDVLRRVRAQMGLTKIRQAAAAAGLDRLTMEEIDAEIGTARQERRQGMAAAGRAAKTGS